HNGEIYFDPEIKKYSQDDDTQIKSTLTINEKPENLLSDREKEILILVCREYSSAQIAEKLFISTGTVDTHRKNILLKLGVTNTVGLVKYALKHRLLED
ncbi:MAG: response regulator transcription factor, partial [Bacteroidia bacterium]|nr:response regulator transcription factor [Bacteroidia bacterium]